LSALRKAGRTKATSFILTEEDTMPNNEHKKIIKK